MLRPQQRASLELVFASGAKTVPLPDRREVEAYRKLRRGQTAEALFWIDRIYGHDEGLKALAFRDSDGDTVPDFTVSDFFGRFREGDVDLDGDGVRNLYDGAPYDPERGGRDRNGDGIPDSGFDDRNGNGLPDAVDWATARRDPELARIQLGLFRDHGILLVERDARFDLELAKAVDDAVRRVFRAYFERHPVMPTLRTVAAEHVEYLSPGIGTEVEETSAQVFRHSQSLIVYDLAREGALLGLLGTLVHEVGHAYHLSLDFDAASPLEENGRLDLPNEHFVELVARFGWSEAVYEDGFIGGELAIVPRFLYMGTSGPAFHYWEESPEAWQEWYWEQYEGVGAEPDYLSRGDYAEYGIVGEYSLSDPGEWFGDNLIAYLITVLEEEASSAIEDPAAARAKIDDALREVWPDFSHRNLAEDARAYFESTFPIRESDRVLLAERYLVPLLER